MSNNKQLQTALEIAVMAHKGVTRRNTDPYIFHVLRVANNAKYNAEFLREKGIDDDVLNILSFLTHDKEKTTYSDYIDNICNNVDAMLVKLSDLTDNLDQGTLSVITDRDRERFIVYENARTKIMSTLARDYPETFKEIMRTGN